jgi:hypothetical protein
MISKWYMVSLTAKSLPGVEHDVVSTNTTALAPPSGISCIITCKARIKCITREPSMVSSASLTVVHVSSVAVLLAAR